MFRWMRVLVLVLGAASLAGCGPRGDATRPVPTAFVPAKQAAQRLVVVLPGRGDDLAGLRDSGIVQAIQDVWPDADVELAAVTLDYYMQGSAIPRLHDEVIGPARKRGYRQIWLSGASMGGMGALLYDGQYPREIDGLVLLAPFLGEDGILDEVRAAGGLSQWNPGPHQALSDNTWQRELWRHIKDLSNDPASAQRVWLAYGDQDSLGPAITMMVPALPADHVRVRPGGHRWTVWTPAMGELLQAASGK
ncbi:MAG: alpha/beta hydrolase-fold protein [Dokdonella sp.]